MASFPALLVALLFCFAALASGQLNSTFYNTSCPNTLSIIQSAVKSAVSKERRMGASLLRLHFHDCFVQASLSYVIDHFNESLCILHRDYANWSMALIDAALMFVDRDAMARCCWTTLQVSQERRRPLPTTTHWEGLMSSTTSSPSSKAHASKLSLVPTSSQSLLAMPSLQYV